MPDHAILSVFLLPDMACFKKRATVLRVTVLAEQTSLLRLSL